MIHIIRFNYLIILTTWLLIGCAPKNSRNLTDEQKTQRVLLFEKKLSCIEEGSQVNKIDSIFSKHVIQFHKDYSESEVLKLKKIPEILLPVYHFSFGLRYRNNSVWNNTSLWSELCFFHPDGVSSAFLEFLHKSLNNQKMNIQEYQMNQTAHYANNFIAWTFRNPVCGSNFRKIPGDDILNITVDCGKEYYDRYWDFNYQKKEWRVSNYKPLDDDLIEQGISLTISEYSDMKLKDTSKLKLAEMAYKISNYYRNFGKTEQAGIYLVERAQYIRAIRAEYEME